MVPVEMRQLPHVSFTQLDQYLRCPLRYRLTYVDRLEPEFLPAALAFGSGIHGAAAFLFRGLARGARSSLADVQGYFESVWNLEGAHRLLRFGVNRFYAPFLCARTSDGRASLLPPPHRRPLRAGH